MARNNNSIRAVAIAAAALLAGAAMVAAQCNNRYTDAFGSVTTCLTAGSQCTPGADSQLCFDYDYACDSETSTCEPSQFYGYGASCGNSSTCSYGLTCVHGTCLSRPQGANAPCNANAECMTGHCVDHRCAAAADGARCTPGYFSQCGPQSYCKDQVCTARLASGASCSMDYQLEDPCAVGEFCSFGQCTAWLSQPSGTNVSYPILCQSGVVDGGLCVDVGQTELGSECGGGSDLCFCTSDSSSEGVQSGYSSTFASTPKTWAQCAMNSGCPVHPFDSTTDGGAAGSCMYYACASASAAYRCLVLSAIFDVASYMPWGTCVVGSMSQVMSSEQYCTSFMNSCENIPNGKCQ